MKKLSIALCTILFLTLLAGCSAGGVQNSSSLPDSSESIVPDSTPEATTTSTTATTTAEEPTDNTTTASVTTTTTTTPATTTTKKPAEIASTTTTTTTTAKPTTTTTTTAAPKPNAPKMLLSIEVDSMPTKTVYKTGDDLDTKGLTLKLTYNDGSTETATNGFTTHGFYSKTPGNKTVTIAYKRDASTYTCTFEVKVEKKEHGTPNINANFHNDKAQEVLKLLNEERKKAGIGELKMDNGNMMNAAKIRAKEITIDWAHERPDHAQWDTVFDEENVEYRSRGENLAKGHTSVEDVFNGWMNSPAHKTNMMHPDFTHVSIVCMEYDGHFYWVQLFGA